MMVMTNHDDDVDDDLNNLLDIVDPTEVKLLHFLAIRQFSPPIRYRASVALHFEPNLGED